MSTVPAEERLRTSSAGRKIAAVGLVLVAVSLSVALWLRFHHRPAREVVVQVKAAPPEESPAVYTAEVLDAITDRTLKAEVGRRYKVIIEDTSKEGLAGVARIGGLVTFVPSARVGEILIVEVTKLKKTSAEARIIRRVEFVGEPQPIQREKLSPASAPADSPVIVGNIYTGVVEDVGKKGDGIVRVGGKVVFLDGVTQKQTVVFRIVEDKPRFARGALVEHAALPLQGSSGATAPAKIWDGGTATADDVREGRLFEVVITEKDKKSPEKNGVARIGGLVVFVPETQPGERVIIRIEERHYRFATSSVVERKGRVPLGVDQHGPNT